MFDTIYWLIAMFVFLLIELATVNLATIWFAVGSAVAGIVSTFCDNGYIQFGLFLAVSVVTLLLVRPSVSKKFNSKTETTNVDSLIGKTVIITEKVDNIQGTGSATLEGNPWTARSESDDVTFDAGEKAVVTSIVGVKLILTK